MGEEPPQEEDSPCPGGSRAKVFPAASPTSSPHPGPVQRGVDQLPWRMASPSPWFRTRSMESQRYRGLTSQEPHGVLRWTRSPVPQRRRVHSAGGLEGEGRGSTGKHPGCVRWTLLLPEEGEEAQHRHRLGGPSPFVYVSRGRMNSGAPGRSWNPPAWQSSYIPSDFTREARSWPPPSPSAGGRSQGAASGHRSAPPHIHPDDVGDTQEAGKGGPGRPPHSGRARVCSLVGQKSTTWSRSWLGFSPCDVQHHVICGKEVQDPGIEGVPSPQRRRRCYPPVNWSTTPQPLSRRWRRGRIRPHPGGRRATGGPHGLGCGSGSSYPDDAEVPVVRSAPQRSKFVHTPVPTWRRTPFPTPLRECGDGQGRPGGGLSRTRVGGNMRGIRDLFTGGCAPLRETG